MNLISNPKGAEKEARRTARAEFYRQWLLMENVPGKDIEKMDLIAMTAREVKALVTKRTGTKTTATNGGQFIQNARRQKVEPMNEVAKWIEEGWEFVQRLSDDQVIIRSPPLD